MGRWVVPAATALVGILGVIALWTQRASGGICVDGVYEDTGEAYGYCADYSSASGALPATIAIVLLAAAAFVWSARRPVALVLGGLVIVAIIAGLVANLTIIDYPPDYPAIGT